MQTPWSNARLREIVEDFVHSERDRAVLVRKYCDKRTIEQVAEEFDVSVSTIKRILLKHSSTVFGIMEKDRN